MKRIIINLLLVFFTCVLLYSGYNLFNIVSEYGKGRSEYSKTSKEVVTENETVSEDPVTKEKVETAPIHVDFDKLLAKNNEVAGWIYCPKTVVNYPVMHAADNDYYLHRLVSREYNFAGCIFEDYRNSPEQMDPATILYGHNMNDGSMFAMLHEYTDQKYYDKHPTMWYLTPQRNYRLDLLMGFVAKEDDEVYGLFENVQQMREYLNKVEDKSTFEPKVKYDLNKLNSVIVLSTCAYEFNNARYIVIAVPIIIH